MLNILYKVHHTLLALSHPYDDEHQLSFYDYIVSLA
jgi:hypothetical protein